MWVSNVLPLLVEMDCMGLRDLFFSFTKFSVPLSTFIKALTRLFLINNF